MNWKDWEVKEINLDERGFPTNLQKIKNPPKQIYFRGNLNDSVLSKSITVVGSRRMTTYGREVVDRFVSLFVTNKVATISGFMYGVDTEVHKKTVEFGGVTIAVFGCGINICYPVENDDLYSEILEKGGSVISEYPPDSKPQLWKYPQRNRIVAGLSSTGVLIVEAGEKSGSLITADFAIKQGKKVYAVPGQITSKVSLGTNYLIKHSKAFLVTDPSDILGGRAVDRETNFKENLSEIEIKICKTLELEPMTTDEIAISVNMSVIDVTKTISLMSLKGLVTEAMGKFHLVKN
ncbi:DNA protecting protein DprA [Candidatus Woesebacteria bacterium RIFCSPHIGHO2_01_FULL_39_23]|uniref:DNA protecting protein DprA n=1 Tax=candidate division WWE3 bacterium RIFCSPLOWO2_01_FULL_37_15 TaxID=1802622 RepID=A0A1F4UXE9_UNCKA|nr:MAG: DNA protecting protein DprA [candidate division WWE3 bacterium RIFCSPLOWO2_01_FULL_37_15]OGM22688.1 MAG: DNA protecting protein DprA [Candidatus Woesebacteria bacterium RIFCSPHIGHO2_01_FULL_39_23]